MRNLFSRVRAGIARVTRGRRAASASSARTSGS